MPAGRCWRWAPWAWCTANGTSPLYAGPVIFNAHANAAHTTVPGVYGVVSLIFWALTIIVSIKYAGFVMRAHERRRRWGYGADRPDPAPAARGAPRSLVTLGIFGAGLFFGDGMITPAISVTSAVEGLKVAAPGLAHLVVPFGFTVFEHGIIKRRITGDGTEEDADWARGHPVLFPNILVVGSENAPNFQFRVPVDDTHTLHIFYTVHTPEPACRSRGRRVRSSSACRSLT